MAIKKKAEQTGSVVSRIPQRNNQPAPVLAYANCKITDKDGKQHSLPKGIPLTGTDKVTRSILADAEKNPDKEYTFTVTVNFVDDGEENLSL